MKPGFIAIYTVLIVLAVILSITLTVTYLSIGSNQGSLALYQGENSLTFVEGCTEDALLRARNSATFGDPVGTPVTFSRPEGVCQTTVVSKTGNTWTMNVAIAAAATPSPAPSVVPINIQYTRTVQVIFDRTSTGISLTSWLEI